MEGGAHQSPTTELNCNDTHHRFIKASAQSKTNQIQIRYKSNTILVISPYLSFALLLLYPSHTTARVKQPAHQNAPRSAQRQSTQGPTLHHAAVRTVRAPAARPPHPHSHHAAHTRLPFTSPTARPGRMLATQAPHHIFFPRPALPHFHRMLIVLPLCARHSFTHVTKKGFSFCTPLTSAQHHPFA